MASRHGAASGERTSERTSSDVGTTPSIQGVTDAELMTAVGSGDSASWSELLRRHWHAIVCYAAAMLDHDAAEDVAQETFLRAAAHAARWRPVGQLRSYLLHIARNLVLNERRSERSRFAAITSARPMLARRAVPTPVELLEESELKAAILRALDAMPARRREVFALVRFGGLSYREAAGVMRISEQTTANHVSQAMADIRRAIEPFASEPA